MEQDKYYTPELDELHIGYICEMKYGKAFDNLGWFNLNISKNFLQGYFNILNIDSIRTKYLDQQDIESLGWKWSTNSYLGEEYEAIFNGVKYRLWQIEYSYDILIDIEKGEYTKYDGECKSINELRKLMSWLKIK